MTKIISSFAIFIICTNSLISQNIQGTVMDVESQKPVPYVHLLNKCTYEQAVSDMEGRFQIQGRINDTIQFSSVGYHSGYQVVSKPESLAIKLFPVTYNLKQIDVYSKDPIPQIYRSEVSFDEKPNLLETLAHPISFLYYRFSKRERGKLEVRNLMEYERKMAKVSTIYTKELVQKLTGFTDEKLDDCFRFCNANIELSEGDDEFSVKYKILELLAKYREQ
ncbi:MAG: carboxypeptidase-like regulatory domain-containing protein [Salinivirgaceae bacterium]|nr:carboxypeptidase-like regulatory domain-containing protein [Salinivirgaceae bacterium]